MVIPFFMNTVFFLLNYIKIHIIYYFIACYYKNIHYISIR